jgi:hypothetical protein
MKTFAIAVWIALGVFAAAESNAQGYVYMWSAQPAHYPVEWCYPCAPTAINWSSPCYNCEESTTVESPKYTKTSPVTMTASVAPVARYTIINKDGILHAFNRETGEMYRHADNRWDLAAGSIPASPVAAQAIP